jgi:hypothetical protein
MECALEVSATVCGQSISRTYPGTVLGSDPAMSKLLLCKTLESRSVMVALYRSIGAPLTGWLEAEL